MPAGFVITAEAYLAAMSEGGQREEIARLSSQVDADTLNALYSQEQRPSSSRRAEWLHTAATARTHDLRGAAAAAQPMRAERMAENRER